MKYTVAPNQTEFRHIDINIDRCAKEGHGKNMIQGSVSFDDEDNENCTIIVPRMHQYLEEWDICMCAHGYCGTDMVEWIQKHMWMADDANHFGTDWTHIPCHICPTAALALQPSTVAPFYHGLLELVLIWRCLRSLTVTPGRT